MTDLREMQIEFVSRIQKHQGILHKVCFVYTKNKTEKEDLYQEIVLQLWKSYTSFRQEAKFSTWMYRVAINTAITLSRKTNIFDDNKEILSTEYDFEEVEDYTEEIKILYKAISKLSKIEKAIILLWLEEKTYGEIAQIVGISEKNVSVKLVRSKKKLAIIINMTS